jgi:arsenate reductase
MPEVAAALVLYGITNCDQVKRARRWLDEHQVSYRFHDFRRDGLRPEDLERWLQRCDWNTLINRQGTTWRSLEESARPTDAASARRVALLQPTLIKRPVLEDASEVLVGFSQQQYECRFGAPHGR